MKIRPKKLKPQYILQSAWDFFGRRPSNESDEPQHILSAEGEIIPYKDPPITLYSFDENNYQEFQPTSLEELYEILEREKQSGTCWIDIEGRGNQKFIQSLGTHFNLHELELEDIVNLHQRPKIEENNNHLFVISRMLYHCSKDSSLTNEQVAFFIFEETLLTIQEENEDAFDPVRVKLRKNKSNIRKSTPFHLGWHLMDAIVDHYFPMLETIGEKLDQIESELFVHPEKRHLGEIQALKREVFFLKKAIWAERDKISELSRSSFYQIEDQTRLYLRDTYDHSIQIIDIIESQKEISYSLMEVYLSSQNNKMSEVMKVLTVISSIFIPLTFIVGIYGMNFSPTDDHGNAAPLNMPELYNAYGYPIVWGVMIGIAVIQIIYFKKKNWM
jgi:magnesium transporter